MERVASLTDRLREFSLEMFEVTKGGASIINTSLLLEYCLLSPGIRTHE